MKLTIAVKHKITLNALVCAATHVLSYKKPLTRKNVWAEMRSMYDMFGSEDLEGNGVDEINRWYFLEDHFDEAVAWVKTLPLKIPQAAWDGLFEIKKDRSC